jgi:DNA polymerase
MDARERLRAYLEQRRELGESEFVLDGMSVEDALSAIDKLRKAHPPTTRREPQRATIRESEPAPAVRPRIEERRPDVRTQPRAEPGSEREAATPAAPTPDPADAATKKFTDGLSVGNAAGTLFEQNPFHGVESLDALATIIAECTRCKLYKTARCGVPGEGDHDADMMCVGEGPGANEDETGRPFVGQAGQLLTKILGAIDLTREQVFITNVVKHRPPGNRNPEPDEVEACSPYLVRQIQMVKPKVILALGTFAAQTLLQTKTPIGKLRGAVHRYYGIPVIVTYHPAALLRNPAWKRPTWEDVKLARHVLDSAKS